MGFMELRRKSIYHLKPKDFFLNGISYAFQYSGVGCRSLKIFFFMKSKVKTGPVRMEFVSYFFGSLSNSA